MTQTKLILVLGETGQQGSAVAHSLRRQRQKVRAMWLGMHAEGR